ncbi:efflux RND transporter periplasmic adaptor subunit [Methylocystis sp. MitZ-2018]|nr:efflux RND transporter periplasmic adaptor subunit [Methylocystis sp. MitZ-2018]
MKRRGYLGRLALAALLILTVSPSVGDERKSTPDKMEMPGSSDASKTRAAPPSGFAEVRIAPEVQQRIGVTLGTVRRTPLTMTIRTVGIVRPNETKLAHIHLKTEGWVEKLFISFTGQKVKAGDPMLSIYSPAFFAAQREFLVALQYSRSAPSPGQQNVVDTTRQRLALWDVPKSTIDALEKTGKPSKSLILRSPISGVILEKKTFEGQYVMPQAELYTVADLSTVWVQAKVFAYELPHVALGMPATVTFSSLVGRSFAGKIVFIDPVVDEMTRTVQVRLEVPNPDGLIKPGMFANVLITHAMGSGLTVPTSAVIRTGERDIAFRAVSADLFLPVQVKISPLRFEDRFEILEGLKAGDEVVTSANFLIDSESRLRAGGGGMVGMPGMEEGEKGAGGKPAEKEMDTKGMPMKKTPEGGAPHSKMQH